MAALGWPELFDRLVESGLEITKEPGPDGWATARCFNPGAHSHGDKTPSLRVNRLRGGARCETQGCVSGSLNDVAKLMNVSIYDEPIQITRPVVPPSYTNPTRAVKRTPTLEELATLRGLPVETLRFLGIQPTVNGWTVPIDDADAGGVVRTKSIPGIEPKYGWAPAGKAKAAEYVYGLSRVDPDLASLIVAEGEPDAWVLNYVGHPAISFLAGAGTPPHAKALAKIKARCPKITSVVLIYDNDAGGKGGAEKVKAALLSAGFTVYVADLGAAHADCNDLTEVWLKLGCDQQAFDDAMNVMLSGAEVYEPVEPKITQIDDASYEVRLPVDGGAGWAMFTFEHVARTGRGIEAELSASLAMPGYSTQSFSCGVSLGSLSGRKDLADQLKNLYGDLDWATHIVTAYEMVKTAYRTTDRSVDLYDVADRPMLYRVDGFLPEGEPAILFGDGGVFKTYEALLMAICIAKGIPYVGMGTTKGGVLYVDAESTPERMRSRVGRLLAGLSLPWERDLITYWPSKGRCLADMAEAIRDLVRRKGIEVILLDSVALLCGGEPERADVASAYFNALAYIGKTSLSIAHVTKASEQTKPFGSAFWHNSARITWNVQRVQEEGESVINVGVYNRKANDDALAAPLGLRVLFDGRDGPISVTRHSVQETQQLAEQTTVPARIRHALKAKPRTEAEICEAMGLEPDDTTTRHQVRSRLSEMARNGKVQKSTLDGRYALITTERSEDRAG